MTAHEKLAQGSYGYFIAEGDKRAADRIMSYVNDPDYDKYFNLGNEADATSLKCMKKSLDYLKECNELMEREGLTPFLVNNEQMALAQIGTNIASVTHDHSGEVGAENLAWSNSLKQENTVLMTHGMIMKRNCMKPENVTGTK